VQTDNTGSSSTSDDMTVQKCLDFCTSGGFPLAGVEYTRYAFQYPLKLFYSRFSTDIVIENVIVRKRYARMR
jgi:hypothetical protein